MTLLYEVTDLYRVSFTQESVKHTSGAGMKSNLLFPPYIIKFFIDEDDFGSPDPHGLQVEMNVRILG